MMYSQGTSMLVGRTACRNWSMNSAKKVITLIAMVAWMPSSQNEAFARQLSRSSAFNASNIEPDAACVQPQAQVSAHFCLQGMVALFCFSRLIVLTSMPAH